MASSHRERLLPAQGLPQDRNSLRQAGKKLSRFRLPHSCYHMVDLMSLGPSIVRSFTSSNEAWKSASNSTSTFDVSVRLLIKAADGFTVLISRPIEFRTDRISRFAPSTSDVPIDRLFLVTEHLPLSASSVKLVLRQKWHLKTTFAIERDCGNPNI